jgi:hypothetical protein
MVAGACRPRAAKRDLAESSARDLSAEDGGPRSHRKTINIPNELACLAIRFEVMLITVSAPQVSLMSEV